MLEQESRGRLSALDHHVTTTRQQLCSRSCVKCHQQRCIKSLARQSVHPSPQSRAISLFTLKLTSSTSSPVRDVQPPVDGCVLVRMCFIARADETRSIGLDRQQLEYAVKLMEEGTNPDALAVR